MQPKESLSYYGRRDLLEQAIEEASRKVESAGGRVTPGTLIDHLLETYLAWRGDIPKPKETAEVGRGG